MSNPVIRVENLAKRYRIGLKEQSTESLGQQSRNLLVSPFKYLKSVLTEPSPDEVFWALRDVSFEVERGEVLGIIGRNGAGKSTLLKILSRITEPTKGIVEIRGRVGSLLEVGTGFHPDLTGRENTYLNGTIMGMKKREIDRHFDEIVGFAEVEKFIDTPVKHYSSGMYTRLAFAVAAHLDPEILIVDEVLAVGDAKFQKKCITKMQDVSHNQGKTVLVVSHNMQTLLNLCSKSILLSAGVIESVGSPEKVSRDYLEIFYSKSSTRSWDNLEAAPGSDVVKLHCVKAVNKEGHNIENFKITEPIGLQMTYEVFKEGATLWQSFNFYNSDGVNIFDTHNVSSRWYREPHPVGKFTSLTWVPANLLAEGHIVIGCAIFNHASHVIHFNEKDVIVFNVVDPHEPGSARGDMVGPFNGLIRPLLQWETQEV
jgi:lipopolysaccharide transport system ATP-binding protein